MKHCTKFQGYLIAHVEGEVFTSYITHSTPIGSTTTWRKIIGSSCPENIHIYKWQWSFVQSFKAIWKTVWEEKHSRVQKLYYTLHPCWIHHNLKENNWILLSRRYAHLQMARKLCTKFQVYLISGLGGEALARFCDRQTARRTDGQKVQKQYVSPWKRGDINTRNFLFLKHSIEGMNSHITPTYFSWSDPVLHEIWLR